ncbi:MAG: serine hydrolase [Bacteroidota bacterium]|nr:serine hydrolase [Bacteroidota bacterium]
MANPSIFRYQIIYTQINRDKNGVPHFTNYELNTDSNQYFNPASMVKMPLAFLSLEKLNELNKQGVNKNTTIQFDSNYQRQVAMYQDASAPNEKPTLAHLIKRAFLISENDPYNRMYQFMGQGEINRKLHQKGYSTARITRQFMGYTEEQNRHTNGIRFIDEKGNNIYTEAPKYNTDSFYFGPTVLIGNAHWNSNDEVVNAPFNFTKHNNISLEDMRKMLQAVVFPASVEKQNRFNLKEEDRLFLLQYLSQYPSETNYPKYDTTHFYDSYVKFFFQDSTHRMPNGVRVFNKVGWAYGFLTDVSYVLDTKNNIDYMLAATVYVNSDGVVNDSKYDEATVGFPFLKQIGTAFYNYELQRKRKYQPTLKNQVVQYEKRDPLDTRPSIKEVDN